MSNASLENAYACTAQLQGNTSRPPLRHHIRRSELRQIVPLSDTTIYEMEQRNEFPRRIVLLPRVVVWDLAEVEAWMDQRRVDTESGKAKTSPKPDVRKRQRRPVRRD